MDRWLDVFGARCAGCGAFGEALCEECRHGLTAPERVVAPEHVDALWAAFRYSGAARKLVLDLKLHHLRPAAAPLATAMVDRMWTDGCEARVVTWVPGRPKDMLDRGFDHAHVLARRVARATGLPLRRLLHRVGEARDQTELDRQQRRENVIGAFAGRDVRLPVLLIDDLVTTGATSGACATALKWAGAPRVEVLVACCA
ncbi:MAG: ComF family protein [Actinomycetota bacterium]